ncbi:pseudouridylate synthase-like protein [Leishmania major strain Friedlin]|uniref:Pseudouridylate synthase-like protein n=1 Tax=Leishmania major TaxID=5664 RepID=Q4Q9E9_LEIMA|nr:pseudouridylate synthase-like protein [Leishmania major strain Friedlin]CAG9576314.1 pseudouridylate_synthase-like_protein [Leishmania major strain Friedlin]CAJ04679.1 pseudouridylate synthase-like protein [Leishmania major strain Friedlin]|eukprot:XP_001684049.1 pseudouridylate synthase-like protein [Leishmania major strain Friedlin]
MRGKTARRRPDPRRMMVGKAPKNCVHIGLCVLYSGSGFRGLQIQVHAPTCHTVEGVLIQALKDAGIIADVVRGRPAGEHHHFARSCRTDRGVHAIRNMVSLFVPKEVFEKMGQAEGICEKLNRQLPATVRVANVMQLSGSFIPRHCCNRRVYRYMLPLYALLPPCDTWAAVDKYYPGCLAHVQALAEEAAAAQRTQYSIPYVDLEKMNAVARPADAQALPSSWLRDLKASADRCNQVLRSHFTGSRRYHNFSVDIDSNRSGVSAKVIQPTTDEALRAIYRSEVCPRLFFFPCSTKGGAADEAPVPVHGESRTEYDMNLLRYPPRTPTSPEDTVGGSAAASTTTTPTGTSTTPATCLSPNTTALPFLFFQIEGCSFLLNMIRKIIGSVLAVCRGARESILEDAFSPECRVTTPLAPGPYLYLAQSTYHGYDRSIGGAGNAHQPGRLKTVQDAWGGAVSEAAELFAFHKIAADIVDVDLNAMPPLDDILAARDRAREASRPHTAVEDAHLAEMKEYKPVLPTRIPWPASSDMTVFLRLLRVHNWNVRPIQLDPACKALREIKNRKERLTASSVAAAASPGAEASKAGEADGGDTRANEATVEQAATPTGDAWRIRSEGSSTGGVPEGGEDGWLYVADTPEEASVQRQAYFASLWKRARPWEYDDATGKSLIHGGEVGTEDDFDDGDGSTARPRRHRRV